VKELEALETQLRALQEHCERVKREAKEREEREKEEREPAGAKGEEASMDFVLICTISKCNNRSPVILGAT